MRELVRRNLRFFFLGSTAAVVLRLIFFLRFPAVVSDSFIYGDIAKNWLQHGIYGLSVSGGVAPTYIRLPGYPAFLALVFAISGMEHYRAALMVQMVADFATCLLCADITFRILGAKAAKAAFLLAALCPFLANYSAAALTETLEIFFTALALDLVIRGLQETNLRYWLGCGAACGAAMLVRPDGNLLFIAIEAYLAARFLFNQNAPGRRLLLRAALVVAVVSVLPLAPWALRNWHVFHRFQPLAPRYANEENEFVPAGFNHWVKTWIADYVSVEEFYWQVPGSEVDAKTLPSRAFDTRRQQTETTGLIVEYNQMLHVSPALDREFEALASERIRARPVRYYAWLPGLRIADMWLRPRTEMLPSDSRWWEFNDDPKWSVVAISLGAVNLFYLLCALAGGMRSRKLALAGLLLLFVALRSGFLGTLENPEPRYTLEMYPVVIVFAAAALVRKT